MVGAEALKLMCLHLWPCGMRVVLWFVGSGSFCWVGCGGLEVFLYCIAVRVK
jgi:hypothetical protein